MPKLGSQGRDHRNRRRKGALGNFPPAGSPRLSRARALWISVGLIAANLAIYGAVRRYEFVSFDDLVLITRNATVATGLTWRGMAWAFTTAYQSNWQPVTWLSHMLDVQVYGMDPGGHHLTNLVLHIFSTLLLFGLLYRTTGAVGRSSFVAALFAVHPLHVESVAWVARRNDVLGALFWMLTLWSYVSYLQQPRLRRYVLVVVFFALGLMSAPMLVTLPLVLLLLDYWPLYRITSGAITHDEGGSSQSRTVWLQLLREKLPLFALATAAIVITVVVQQRTSSVAGFGFVPLYYRVANAVLSYVAYVGVMFWPARLSALYPYPMSLPSWRVTAAALVLIAAFCTALGARRRHPYLLVGWLWYFGTLLPDIGLVRAGNQQMADRYTYVPLIGLFLVVAWGATEFLSGWRHRRISLAAAAAVVLATCATVARAQVHTWENSVALWQQAVDVTSDNYIAHMRLAEALARQGRLDKAITHYLEAVRLRPLNVDARLSAANALFEAGRTEEAIAQYSEALRIRPGLEAAHNGVGLALKKQGKRSEAIAHFEEAVRLKPEFADAHHNLAMAFAEQRRLNDAISEMSKAVQFNPDHAPSHYRLAVFYRIKGDLEQARYHYERALALNPNDEMSRRSLETLKSRAPR